MQAFANGVMKQVGAPFGLNKSSKLQSPSSAPTSLRPVKVILQWIGLGRSPGKSDLEAQQRLLEEGKAASAGRCNVGTQTASWATTDSLYARHNTPKQPLERHVSSSSERNFNEHTHISYHDSVKTDARQMESLTGSEDRTFVSEGQPDAATHEDAEASKFPDENRMVLVDSFISMLLTEESIHRLGRIIVTSRVLKQHQIEFGDVNREASIGQSYIDNAESQINDPQTPERYRKQIETNLEQRKPGILKNIQRKQDLEQKLRIQQCNLEYLREQSDDVFEQILGDAGLLEEQEIPQSLPNSPNAETDMSDLQRNDSAFQELHSPQDRLEDNETLPEVQAAAVSGYHHPIDSEILRAQEEHTQAYEALQTAGKLFDQRQEAYDRDVARTADDNTYSREEIDLFHLKMGAQLSKNLREAEEEFERTRAQAKALNILASSEMSCLESDGYRESQDAVQHADMVDRTYIEWWLSDVAAAQDLPSPPAPSMDWDAESVNISESCSVRDENPRQRRLIDRYHAEQESLRQTMTDL